MKIFGIDQTGAMMSKSKAKPLKALELIVNNENQPQDLLFFEIPNLTDWIRSLNPSDHNHIFIDCVLGLPMDLAEISLDYSIRDWIKAAENYNYNGNRFGRNVSEPFFDGIKKFYGLNENNFPKRNVEILLKSNSVFTTRPFQKNIQTGTFRIWKELAPVLEHIVLWPTDFYLNKKINVIFYEVYPSHFYQKLFDLKFRTSDPLIKWASELKMANPDFNLNSCLNHLKNPDYCDALVASLGGFKTITEKNVWANLNKTTFFEGDTLR